MTAWLTIIGIGEDGWEGLAPIARSVVEDADWIVGGERHLAFLPDMKGQQIQWESPFKKSFDRIKELEGEKVVVLATGNPMWFGVGASLKRAFPEFDMRIIPASSAYSLAAARMNWSIPDIECLTVHSRPLDSVRAFLRPDARLIILSRDGCTPSQLSAFLTNSGYGGSEMTVLSQLGGPAEARIEGTAESWRNDTVSDLNIIALHCIAGEGAVVLGRTPGLPDDAFVHDGQLTKREVRAVTLSVLQPMPGQLLWDVGAGCGSVSIEWMRAAANTRAVAIENNARRCELIEENALALGVPELELVKGEATALLSNLKSPDAVYIGGGLTSGNLIATCWNSLNPYGRLVVNAVTFEGERLLAEAMEEYGGELVRLEISRNQSMGRFQGWQPFKPVTQWRINKIE